MTEKHYGGSSKFGFNSKSVKNNESNNLKNVKFSDKGKEVNKKIIEMDEESIKKIKKAGSIAAKVKAYAREIIKPGMKLIDIAEKIDDKIFELGGKPAFPVNLSIDNIAAHFTPNFNCGEVARGLLKIDTGVHVDGYIADTAFSLDLENSEENRKLISASEAGLKASVETFGLGVSIGKIGKNIQEAIEKNGSVSIKNLSGHSIDRYVVHSGWIIPNYDSGQNEELVPGLYATEPFATNGNGMVKDGAPSGIYKVDSDGNPRDTFPREVLKFIKSEFEGLPFAGRWIHKKFGTRGLLALRQMEQSGIIYQYAQLVEISGGKVAQFEHDILLLENGEKIVTTE